MNNSKSIFYGSTVIIPLDEVAYIELDKRESFRGYAMVILSSTTWSAEYDCYNNAAYLDADESKDFIKSWEAYKESKLKGDL